MLHNKNNNNQEYTPININALAEQYKTIIPNSAKTKDVPSELLEVFAYIDGAKASILKKELFCLDIYFFYKLALYTKDQALQDKYDLMLKAYTEMEAKNLFSTENTSKHSNELISTSSEDIGKRILVTDTQKRSWYLTKPHSFVREYTTQNKDYRMRFIMSQFRIFIADDYNREVDTYLAKLTQPSSSANFNITTKEVYPPVQNASLLTPETTTPPPQSLVDGMESLLDIDEILALQILSGPTEETSQTPTHSNADIFSTTTSTNISELDRQYQTLVPAFVSTTKKIYSTLENSSSPELKIIPTPALAPTPTPKKRSANDLGDSEVAINKLPRAERPEKTYQTSNSYRA